MLSTCARKKDKIISGSRLSHTTTSKEIDIWTT